MLPASGRPPTDPQHDDARQPVITGMGAVSPFGWGVSALWKGLRAGIAAIGPFDRFDHSTHRTHIAAQVPPPPEETARRLFAPARRLTLADRFALSAAAEALRAADVNPSGADIGIYFGSSTGGMFESELFYEELVRSGGRRARPSRIVAQECSGPAEAVARRFGVSGPVETVSSACSSGAMAIGTAADAIRAGEVDLALAGGADSLCRLTYAGFNALRSVSERPSIPFRKDRDGLSLGEGAAVVVIEPLERAVGRGARPLARLLAASATCDARHMTAPDPEGKGAARAIEQALAESGISTEDIRFLNAHGTGTPLNDAAEWEAVRRVFGERAGRLPVTSTKSLVGHLLGSAGALEAVATVLCLREREIHPMPGGGEPDEAIGFRLVLDRPEPLDGAGAALSLNLAFGGANAAMILTGWEG